LFGNDDGFVEGWENPRDFLRMAAPRRVDEKLDPLFGNRLMQESMHGSVRDLAGQSALVVDAAGDNEDEVGELRFQALGKTLHGSCNRRGVENRYAGVLGDQLCGQVRFSTDRKNIVVVAEDLQRFHERTIVAQHDQALSRNGFRPGKGVYCHCLSPMLSGAGRRGDSRILNRCGGLTGGSDHRRDVSRHPGTDSVTRVMTLVSLSLKPPV